MTGKHIPTTPGLAAPSPARLAELNRAAAEYYTDTLASDHGAGPRRYLVDRGLGWAATPGDTPLSSPSSTDTGRWVLGYAPPGWTALVGELRSRGYIDAELLAAGLAVSTRRGTLIDRFRDRITFGLHDTTTPAGAVLVGFIGRAAPAAGPGVPKYLNTPTTVLFDKSRVLFGLAEQHHQLTSGAVPVLVEGPLDVLAVATTAARGAPDAAAYAAVAPCGTALTPGHLDALTAALGRGRSAATTVVVAFDADTSGRRAARAAYPLLAHYFNSVRGARLPDGQDPAAVATEDPAGLTATLRTANLLVDDLVDQLLHGYALVLDNAEARVAALRDAMRLVAGLPAHEVARQVARTATRLGFPVAIASNELADAATRPANRPAKRAANRARARLESPGVAAESQRRRPVSTGTNNPRVLPSRVADSTASRSLGR
jgi:DNA primase